jgi:hypothetical protein
MALAGLAALVRVLGLVGLSDLEETDVGVVAAVGFEGGEQARRDAAPEAGLALVDRVDDANVGAVGFAEAIDERVGDERVREILAEAGAAREAILEMADEAAALVARRRRDRELEGLLLDVVVADGCGRSPRSGPARW